MAGGADYAISAKFFAQQAVEKCLKAVIVLNDMEAPRSHNLLELSSMLVKVGEPIPFDPNDIHRLTPYAVLYRYDDDEVIIVQYEEASRFAEGVFKWAKKVVRERSSGV